MEESCERKNAKAAQNTHKIWFIWGFHTIENLNNDHVSFFVIKKQSMTYCLQSYLLRNDNDTKQWLIHVLIYTMIMYLSTIKVHINILQFLFK